MSFKITDICDINASNLSSKDRWQYINYLDTANLNEGMISKLQKLVVGQDKIPSRAKRKVKRNDILISTVRPSQKHYGLLRNIQENMVVSTGFAVLSAKENIVNAEYLYRFLTQKNIIAYLQAIAETSTSAYPSITSSVIGNLDINLPPLEEQKAIAQILSTLDEKIEVNNQINKKLEEIAQAIFKHWFGHFEFQNKNGEPYKSSGGEMVESELGMIPKGWDIVNLSAIADILMGQSPKGTSYNEEGSGKVFYQGRTDFGDRFPIRRLFTTEPKKMAKTGDVLMSVRAPVGDINLAYEDCCIGRGLCSIRSKNGHSSYMYYLMLSLKKKLDIYNGVGTVFGSINKNALNNIIIVKPSDSVIEMFNKVAYNLDQQYLCLVKENRRLSIIRDTLLPKLMSGEIRVSLDNEGEEAS